jgi:hypothetical protein
MLETRHIGQLVADAKDMLVNTSARLSLQPSIRMPPSLPPPPIWA